MDIKYTGTNHQDDVDTTATSTVGSDDIRLVTAGYLYAFEYALGEVERKRSQQRQNSDKNPSLIYSLYRRFME